MRSILNGAGWDRALVLAVVLAAPLASADALGNVLRNGGFENDANADNVPDNWTKVTSGFFASTAPGCVVVKSTDALQGNHSLSVSATGSGICAAQSDAMSAGTGDVFDGVMHIKRASGSVQCFITIRWFDASGTMLTPGSSGVNPCSTDWERGSAAGVAPLGAVTARFFLYGQFFAAGEVLFDAGQVQSS